jgi:hypothetical protein
MTQVQFTIDFNLIEGKPYELFDDKAYDCDELGNSFCKRRIDRSVSSKINDT